MQATKALTALDIQTPTRMRTFWRLFWTPHPSRLRNHRTIYSLKLLIFTIRKCLGGNKRKMRDFDMSLYFSILRNTRPKMAQKANSFHCHRCLIKAWMYTYEEQKQHISTLDKTTIMAREGVFCTMTGLRGQHNEGQTCFSPAISLMSADKVFNQKTWQDRQRTKQLLSYTSYSHLHNISRLLIWSFGSSRTTHKK